MADSATMRGLRRGIEIIDALVNAGTPMTFGEIQKVCDGLAAPTLSRALKVLIDEGMLERDQGQGPYNLGCRFGRMARQFCGVATLSELVKPIIVELGEATQQTSCLFIWEADKARLLAKHEVNESLHIIEVGKCNQRIFRNGFSQACVAQLEESQIRSLLKEMEEQPKPPIPKYLQRLSAAIDDGLLIEEGEANPRIHRVVAPVRIGRTPGQIAAVGICTNGPIADAMEFYAMEVRGAAAKLIGACKNIQR